VAAKRMANALRGRQQRRGVAREIRPAQWIAVGVCAVVGGAFAAVGSVSAATDIASAASAPACVVEFDDGCTTERGGRLEAQRRDRRAIWAQKWFVHVPDGNPRGRVLEVVEVPHQGGESSLRVGDPVALIYLDWSPAWVRTSSGAVLETDEHPRRRALLLGLAALVFLGGGVLGVRTGFASVWNAVDWWERTAMVSRPGPELVVLSGGAGGGLGAWASGWHAAVQLAGAAIGAVVGVVLWRRSLHRLRTEPG
jgi:hypothetical protein